MALSMPPQENEIEVTLIGPNVGESILIHYKNDWLLIDSCKDKNSGLPAALVYLRSLNIAPEQVKVIACSHWHDDHFKGLGQLYEAYPTAKFWMSGALQVKEFIELIEAYRNWPADTAPHTSGLKELTTCLDLIRSRGEHPNFSVHDQRMWFSADGSAELWSLSPSSEMIRKGYQDISRLIPTPWNEKNATSIKTPNHIAVAMHFRAGHHSILLGSDLEEYSNPLTGWSSVIASRSKPRQIASLYKVAHHGSKTAEHPEIWTDLLEKSPISILTPFSRSNLPLNTDIARIKAVSSNVFLSSKKINSTIKRTGALGKITALRKIKVLHGFPGMIRCRINAEDPDAKWSVVLDGLAEKL